MSTTGSWPNLIVGGTQKGGTTWLQRALQRHPDVTMSDPKELYFFGRPGWSDPERQDWYRSHFVADPAVRYRGEATSDYFWHRLPTSRWSPPADPDDDAAVGIGRTLGDDLQVFVLLRSPVERAIAGANHHLTMGRIGPDDDIFAADPSYGIVDLGFYGRHLNHWRSVLDADQLEVILFDDLAADPRAVFERVLERLSLSAEVIDESGWAEICRPTHTRQEIREHRGRSGLSDVAVTESTVRRLVELYVGDVARLEQALGRRLDHWTDGDRLSATLVNV